MERVLLTTDTWGVGGIESMIFAMARCLIEAGIKVDLFASSKWSDENDLQLLDESIEAHFASHQLTSSLPRRHFEGMCYLDSLLKQVRYDAVHVNAMNGTGYLYCWIARRNGVGKVILHSHNTSFGGGHGLSKAAINGTLSKLLGRAPTDRAACSNAAGAYLFGDETFELIRNSIDTDRFAFSSAYRDEVRKRLDIPTSAPVLGFVGRLTEQKNPLWALKVFERVRALRNDAVLVMVGNGALLEACTEWADGNLPRDSFRFVGLEKSPEKLYSAFDMLLFPSRFEGLGISAVEAQCCGLPVLMSDAVPSEAHITELACSLSLARSEMEWAKRVIDLIESEPNREVFSEQVLGSGYGLDALCDAVVEAYGLKKRGETE